MKALSDFSTIKNARFFHGETYTLKMRLLHFFWVEKSRFDGSLVPYVYDAVVKPRPELDVNRHNWRFCDLRGDVIYEE